jgi:hypothetical protein
MWHGFVVLERNTVVMEIKPGPFVPNEFADRAPEEVGANNGSFCRMVKDRRTWRNVASLKDIV